MKRIEQLRSLIRHALPHAKADTPEGDYARAMLPRWRNELHALGWRQPWRDPLVSDRGPGLYIDID